VKYTVFSKFSFLTNMPIIVKAPITIPKREIGTPAIFEAADRVVLSQLKKLFRLQREPDSNPVGNLSAK
jgi:hypothetical protein